MAIDLTQLGMAYINARWGGNSGGGYATPSYMPTPVSNPYPVQPAFAGDTVGDPGWLDLPGVDVVTDPGGLVAKALRLGGRLVYSYAKKKWMIQTRRRRKRLLTPTDMADLAQLQVLVGKGSESMKFAVMKAVRR